MTEEGKGVRYDTFQESFKDIDDEESKRNVMIMSSSPRNFSKSAKDTHLDLPKLDEYEQEKKRKRNEIIRKVYDYSCLGLCSVTTFILSILCIVFAAIFQNIVFFPECNTVCQYNFVETIPIGVDLPLLGSTPTHIALLDLIENAHHSIDLMQYYFSLNNTAESWAHGEYGNEVFEALIAARKRHVEISIVYDAWMYDIFPNDLDEFKKLGFRLHKFNFTRMFGAGWQHTKFVLVDQSKFYLGSANMDWRSLSQVQELGIIVKNCPCLMEDLRKIFIIFVDYISTNVVDYEYDTKVNIHRPIHVNFNHSTGNAFFSSSPPALKSEQRTSDITALLHVIEKAEEFVDISVMSFEPFHDEKEYWPELDSALKNLLFKNVSVRVLVSNWEHTSEMQKTYAKSLKIFGELCESPGVSEYCLGSIEVKEFIVPPTNKTIPDTRVNHGKYVVTDKNVFITTSNFMKKYFYECGGVSFTGTNEMLKDGLKNIFERNWDSKYAHDIVIDREEK